MAEEGKKREITTISETIALDCYDDIFSDFDYGPFETRRLSEDLLDELLGRLHRKTGKISLVFEMPEGLRRPEVEAMVRKRLRQVFFDRWRSASTDISSNIRTAGFRMTVGAAILVVESAFLAFGRGDFWLTLFATLVAPAGWFGLFTGLERLFDMPKPLIEKKEIYGRLKDAEISFTHLPKL